ncbi:MAG: hypothetical protein Q8P76_00345 [bacterium]|nr:hypothetical protein [bacterium]
MKFSDLFSPKIKIAGLDISDNAARLLAINESGLQKSEIALAPGVIRDGKLIDRSGFSKALNSLKQNFGSGQAQLPVVVSLPPNKIYTQTFKLPSSPVDDFREALDINLPLASPIDLKSAFYDWQKLDGEFLAAFAHKSVVAEYLDILSANGFLAVAAEFPALALARLIERHSAVIDLSKPLVVLALTGSGLDLSIVRNGQLYSHSFADWSSGEPEVLNQEISQILNFYHSRWGGAISDLILITPETQSKIGAVIQESHPSLNIRPLSISGFSGLGWLWYVSLGGALRGESFDPEDSNINLIRKEADNGFKKLEWQSFFNSWQRVAIWGLGILAVLFWGVFFLFQNTAADLAEQSALKSQSLEFQQAVLLQGKAAEFNSLLAKVLSAKTQSNNLLLLPDSVSSLAKQHNVTLTELLINGSKVSLTGKAGNEASVINFKNRLGLNESYKNVSLPLSGIISGKNGVSFNLTFEI